MSRSTHSSRRSTLLLAALAVLGTATPLSAAILPTDDGRFIVGLHDEGSLQMGDSYQGGRVYTVNHAVHFIGVETSDAAAFEARARLDPNVRYIEPDPVFDMLAAVDGPLAAPTGPGALFTPNDPGYGSQYGYPQVRADLAWDTTLGDTDASVCVIDTGVQYTHPDLSGSRWMGGYDFVNNDADPVDDHGHGTHVTGTAAATINNAVGVAGMGQVKFYHAKVLNSGGSGSWAGVANGITWCADNAPAGHTVLSMSLGGSAFDQGVQDAVNYAWGKGDLIVAAAGNSGPCSNCVGYPARDDNVIAVSCTQSGETLCGFSSTGPQVDIAAPGNNVNSTESTGSCSLCDPSGYRMLSGTSMSTPHVAGALALYWSYDTAITNAALEARVKNAAQDLGAAGFDSTYGCGELDVMNLFSGTGTCTVPPPQCSDGLDNDGDGLIDYPADPGCTSAGDDSELDPGVCGGGPANNCFANAISLTPPASTTGSNVGATTETNEPLPCGAMGTTVWWRFTALSSGTATINTVGSNYDTVLAAYTGSALGSLTTLACNDDYSGLQSQISFACTAGTTYQVQVGGYASLTGNIALAQTGCGLAPPSAPRSLTATSGPGNDRISLSWAAPLSDGGSPITSYTVYRDSGSGFAAIATLAPTVTSYQDGGLALANVYAYYVKATNAVGTGAASNTACAGTYPIGGTGAVETTACSQRAVVQRLPHPI